MDTRALDAVRVLKGLLALVLSCLFLFLAACGDEGNAGNGTDNGGNNTATTGKMLRMELPEGFDGQFLVQGDEVGDPGSTSVELDLSTFSKFLRDPEEPLEVNVICDQFVFLPQLINPDALPKMVTWDPENGQVAPRLDGEWVVDHPRQSFDSVEFVETVVFWDPETQTFALYALGSRFRSLNYAESDDGGTRLTVLPDRLELIIKNVSDEPFIYTRKE